MNDGNAQSLDLTTLSNEALRTLQGRIDAEIRARALKPSAGHGASKDGGESTIISLDTVEERLEFARTHNIGFEGGINDTLEEDLDAYGVPERYAHTPPIGFVPYRQQELGAAFFPSDRDAVYVISVGGFGSVPSLNGADPPHLAAAGAQRPVSCTAQQPASAATKAGSIGVRLEGVLPEPGKIAKQDSFGAPPPSGMRRQPLPKSRLGPG